MNFVTPEFLGVRQDDSVICFDFFKAYPYYSSEHIIYDIKILYDLEGRDTESFSKLAANVLGKSKIANYAASIRKMNAYWESYSIAKIKYEKFSLDKLLPKSLVKDLFQERKNILLQLFEEAKEKKFYEKFFDTLKCLYEISQKPIHIDLESIKDDNTYFSNLIRSQTKESKLFLHFNPVGAKTGRMSFKKGSVNFYILPKDLRKCLVAPDGFNVVQIDFKSFQPRLAIFCTEDESFKKKFYNINDIYTMFEGDREENKISFISWMFAQRTHPIFDEAARPILQLKKDLYVEAKKSGQLTNKFGRTLHYTNEEDNVVFQNYVTSNEVDAMLSLMLDVHEFLKNKKSRIIMPFHDSLIFYIHQEETHIVDEIKSIMENKHSTLFGSSFPVSVKVGNNFGKMENWK